MNILSQAAAVIVAIGTIGGGALTIETRYAAKSDLDQLAGRVEASQWVTALIGVGARFDRNGKVICEHLHGQNRTSCIYFRSQYYRAIRR
jgi:hypothetical protein